MGGTLKLSLGQKHSKLEPEKMDDQSQRMPAASEDASLVLRVFHSLREDISDGWP